MAGDTANDLLSLIAQKVITSVVDAIGRQFGYLFFYKRNIKNLEEKVKKLENSRDDVNKSFEAEIRNNKEIAQSSAKWLSDVDEVTMAANEVGEAKDKLKGGCLNLKSRYVLSRKSTKLAMDIRELQEQAPILVATNPALPAGMLTGSSSNYASKDFKSRTEIVNNVMEALNDDTVNIIGICGLGGIGKSTILHEVRERAITEKLFVEVSMTTVSKVQNVFNIQSDLAGMLGLIDMKNVENIIARADLLHKRLTSGSKILVILDDVWSEIELKKVGIPVGNDRAKCKVILASRFRSVCTSMRTQETILVDQLPKEEAWQLFKREAGDCVEKEKLEAIAKEVADECGGLPIALITLASALSNKKREVWEDACKQLKQSCVTSIPGMNKNVYLSLRMSYDYLRDELPEAQPLLLVCCQHPEDAVIEVEKLASYCLALELFKNVDKVVDARNRTYAIIDHLKSCFLLQEVHVDEEEKDSKYEKVKMHDVVRDVCLSIVSEMKEERDKVYMHIMAPDTDGYYDIGTGKVDFPKLMLLMAPLDGKLLGITFLEQMAGLRVFENLPGITRSEYMASLLGVFQNILGRVDNPTPALQVLKNLRMLSLEGKSLSEEIMSTIGTLSSLEILSFWRSEISSFPRQIDQLRNLKLLDLRCKKGRGFVPSGMLSGLKKLEVLCMGNFRLLGAAEDKDIQNGEHHGRITELDSLSNLITLQINLVDPNYLLDLRRFRFKNLESFFFGSYFGRVHIGKTIILGNFFGMKWVLEDKIERIVMSTMNLELEDIEDWTDTLILKKFVSLRKLVLKNCKQLEYGIPWGSLGDLQRLVLSDMPVMRNLWVGPIDPLCLGNLIEVKINKCPAIECVFSYSAAKCLVQLRILDISDCLMLERIVSKGELRITTTSREPEIKDELPNDVIVMFPKLRDLTIQKLPKLGFFYDHKLDDGTTQPLVMLPSLTKVCFWNMHQLKHIVGGGMLELSKLGACDWLQNLEIVYIFYCDSLETVFNFERLHVVGENAHVQILGHLKYLQLNSLPNLEHLCRQIPQGIHAFQNLKGLEVNYCDNLGYLISSTMAHMLVNLESLIVGDCKSMKEVVEANEDYCAFKKIVFRSLSRLRLYNCGELSSFCSSEQQSFEFPSLEDVRIHNCPKIKTFCCRHLTAEKLCGVKTSHSDYDDNGLIWKGDLNETVRQLNARVNQMTSDLKEDDVPEEVIANEYAECTNKDNIGSSSSSSTPLEQDTPLKPSIPSSVVSSPNVSLTSVVGSPSPPVSDNNEEITNSSSPDLRKVALPTLNEFSPSASMDQSIHSSDSPVQPKADRELSDMPLSSRDDDWKRKRILIQGVYVKAEMKTIFEEILTAKPNFLSGLRLKMARLKTEYMESAIRSLQILRQRTTHTISPEELAYIKDSLDDLKTIGLDMAWLERGYQRGMLVMKEQKVVSAAAELDMLEREKTEDEVAFVMAREKLEASTARRDAFKAEYGALMQELEAGKELLGGGFDSETSLGDGLLD